MRTLYFRAYDLTDRVWPGPGGWAIRTALVPWRVWARDCDGSEPGGDVSEAADALAEVIEANGPVLPFQYRAKPGKWADLYLAPARERLAAGDADLEREYTSGAGDWDYMGAIATIGMLAVRTGHGGVDGDVLQTGLPFRPHAVVRTPPAGPAADPRFLRTLLLPFTILENHPCIPKEQREETLEAFLGLYRSSEGAGNTGF